MLRLSLPLFSLGFSPLELSALVRDEEGRFPCLSLSWCWYVRPGVFTIMHHVCKVSFTHPESLFREKQREEIIFPANENGVIKFYLARLVLSFKTDVTV